MKKNNVLAAHAMSRVFILMTMVMQEAIENGYLVLRLYGMNLRSLGDAWN